MKSPWNHHEITIKSPWNHHEITMKSPFIVVKICIIFALTMLCASPHLARRASCHLAPGPMRCQQPVQWWCRQVGSSPFTVTLRARWDYGPMDRGNPKVGCKSAHTALAVKACLLGGNSNTKCSMTFVNIAVAISALAGGGAQKRFRTEIWPQKRFRTETKFRKIPCNLQWILLLVFKNIVFYRVSGPSAAQNCTLAMLKNVGFSTVFAWRGGKNRKKLSLKMFST